MMAETGSGAPPIYVLIGTKAQYIKTAPLLRLMQARGIDYVLIDSGQHAAFAKDLRRELEVNHYRLAPVASWPCCSRY